MQRKRMKIFMSAYACEPEKGSEPGIGWNVVLHLSSYHDVHVLTRGNNRDLIEKHVPAGSKPSLTFHYYDLPKSLSFWKKKRRGYRFYYYLWQYASYFKFRRFVNESGFDIVHHLTFANFAMPAPFVFTQPITIWGPVRYLDTPAPILQSLPPKVRIKESLRHLLMLIMTRMEPGRVLTLRRANWVLETPGRDMQSSFSKDIQAKVIHHPQTGINTREPEYRLPEKREHQGNVRLIICSEFVHWKGVIFSAEIFSRIAVRRRDVELIVCGYGPEEKEMRKIFDRYNVADRVSFRGFLDKREMLLTLQNSDILLYPSYHHGLATVILQAMYVGLPIVVLKGDAVAAAVAGACGLAAEGESLDDILDHLEMLTEKLIDDPGLRAELGARGRDLIETTYEWEQLVRKLDGVYQRVAHESKRLN